MALLHGAGQLKVAVVGAGNVGTTLGKMVARKHLVTYGVRDTTKYANLAGGNSKVATVPEAIKWADLVLLATPGSYEDAGIQATAASLGPEIKGKILVDATNPISPYPGLECRWKQGNSGGEVLAAALPDTNVFKAFNTIGENMMSLGTGSGLTDDQLTMLFAGGPEGKDKVAAFIDAVGFKPVWVGPIRYARNLEAIAELWIHLGVPGVGSSDKWGREFHFQALRK